MLYVVARTLAESIGARVSVATELLMASALCVLAFSATWWSQAVYAKVYTLHVLLFGLVAVFLLRWSSEKKNRDLFLVALFFGLACANHLFLALLIGPWLLVALVIGGPKVPSLRQVGCVLAGGILGVLPYLYILLRMPSAPYATVTFERPDQFLKFVLRSNYADVGTGGGDKFGLVASFFQTLYADLGVLLPLLALVGIAVLVRRGRSLSGVILMVGMMTAPAFIVGLRSFGFSEEASYIYRVYGLPSEAFVATGAAVGIAYVWNIVVARRVNAVRYLLAAVMAVTPVFAAWQALPMVRATSDTFIDGWLRGTLESLPQNAVLVVSEKGIVSDTELFGLAYLQVVEGMRKDVTVVTDMRNRPFYQPQLPAGEEHFSLTMQRRMLVEAVLRDPKLERRPILTSFAPEVAVKNAVSRATGYAYALDRDAPLPAEPGFRIPDDASVSYAAAEIAAHLSYLQASRTAEVSGTKTALPMLTQAMRLDAVPQSPDYVGFVHHRAATTVEP